MAGTHGAGLAVQLLPLPLPLPKHEQQGEAGTAGGSGDAQADRTSSLDSLLGALLRCLWHCPEFRHVVSLGGGTEGRAGGIQSLVEALRAQEHALLTQHDLPAQQLSLAVLSPGTPLPRMLEGELRHAAGGMVAGAGASALETLCALLRQAGPEEEAAADATFGLDVTTAVNCQSCGYTTHQESFTQGGVSLRQQRQASSGGGQAAAMGQLLQRITLQAQRACDVAEGGCGAPNHVTHFLDRAARVFTLQLAWESDREGAADIATTVAALDEKLDLADVYYAVEPGQHLYSLHNMVCWAGPECLAFQRLPGSGRFLLLESWGVNLVGCWAGVQRTCAERALQPLLLLYASLAPDEALAEHAAAVNRALCELDSLAAEAAILRRKEEAAEQHQQRPAAGEPSRPRAKKERQRQHQQQGQPKPQQAAARGYAPLSHPPPPPPLPRPRQQQAHPSPEAAAQLWEEEQERPPAEEKQLGPSSWDGSMGSQLGSSAHSMRGEGEQPSGMEREQQLQVEVDFLKERIGRYAGEVEGWRATAHRLRQDNEQLRGETNQLGEANSLLEARLGDLEAECAALAARLAAAEGARAGLLHGREEALGRAAAAARECAELRGRVAELQGRLLLMEGDAEACRGRSAGELERALAALDDAAGRLRSRVVERHREEAAAHARAAAAAAAQPDAASCAACYEHRRDTALNCGHVFCAACAAQLRDCPMCRVPVVYRGRIYL